MAWKWLVAVVAIGVTPVWLLAIDCRTEPGIAVWGIPVRAFTPSFKVVDGLRAEDFSLREGQDIRKLCGLAHRREAASIGILLDASASMDFRANDLALGMAGVNQLFDTSGPDDEYFVESVNDAGTGQYAFRQDVSALRARLKNTAKGRTPLIDCMYRALAAMQQARHANRALVVFSDGYDNASVRRIQDLIQALSSSPVPIFLVIPFNRIDQMRPPLQPGNEIVAREDLSRLAKSSGGWVVAASDRKEMIATVGQVARAIRSPYVLYFESAGNAIPGDIHIEVHNVRRRPMLLYRGARR